MTVRKVRPKQVWKPPPAVDYNAMGAAADMYRRGPDGSPERQQPVATDVIMVRNDSGADKRRGDVLALTRAKLLSVVSREHPWISAEGLDAANRNYILCVLLDPLPAGKIGPAQIAGIAPAYVTVLATWHRRAFPSGGATVQSGLFGPMELMSAPTVTGEQLCHVKIGHADNRSVVAKVGPAGIAAAGRDGDCLVLGSGGVYLYGPTSIIGEHCLLTTPSGDALGITAYNAKCEPVERDMLVRLEPSDDWLPLAVDPSCDETSSSSSDSSSGDSSSGSSLSSDSSSDSESESESESESDSESESGGCDYTGSITLGKGDLSRSGTQVCESLVTLTFENGLLCEIVDAGTKCVDVCDCGSSSSGDSSSDQSSSDSSSGPSSDGSSSDASSSGGSSSDVSSSGGSSSGDSVSDSGSEPSGSDIQPSEDSSGLGSESDSGSLPPPPLCTGNCGWIAVEDTSSEGSDSGSASSEDCTECGETTCNWEAVLYEGVIVWSRRSNCSSPCACDYPTTGPSFVGETITGSCTCGCGHCAYVRVLESPYWLHMSGCADWQNCTCPSAPANFYDYSVGQMVIASCG